MLADLARHVVRAADEGACDVEVVHGDDAERDEEVHQKDHHRVDLGVHLIGERVRHAVHEGHVTAVTLRRGDMGGERGRRGEREEGGGVEVRQLRGREGGDG